MITEIVRPKTVREAVRAKLGPDCAYLGGGTWLNSGASAATRLISLEKLGLAGIDVAGRTCAIGAMATFQQIADEQGLPGALRDAARLTASRTLRNMKTLGGELGRRPDDSAIISVLIALEATINVAVQRRPIPMDAWLTGHSDALVISVAIPDAARRCVVSSVSRTSHSFRSVVVVVSLGEEGRVASIVVSDCRGHRLLLTVPADGPVERSVIETSVREAFHPVPDIHASSDYKRYISGVLAADAVMRLLSEGERP